MSSTRARRETPELSEEDEQQQIFLTEVEPPEAEVKVTNFDSLASYRLKLATELGIPSSTIGLSADELFPTPWNWLGAYFYPQVLFFNQPNLLEKYGEQLYERRPSELVREIAYLKLALIPDLEPESPLRQSSDYEDNWLESFKKALERDTAALNDFNETVEQLEALEVLPATRPMPYKQKQRFEPQIRRPDGTLAEVDSSDWVEIIDRATPTREVPVIFGGPADREIEYSVNGFTVLRKTDQGIRECGLLWDQFLDLQTLPLSFIPQSGHRYLFRLFTPISPRIPGILSRAMGVRFTYTNIVALIDINNQIYKMSYIIAPGLKKAESQHGMTIEFPPETANASSSISNIVTQLERAFPMLEFGKGKNISTYAIFQIQKVNLNWIVFLDMIRRDPLFQKYLVVNERRQAFPMKEKVYVSFSHFSDASLPKQFREREWINLNINAIPEKDETPASIEIIATIDRREQLEVLIPILQRLFQHYRKRKGQYQKELEKYIGKLPTTKFKEKTRQKNLLVTHPIFSLSYWATLPKYRKIEIVSQKDSGALPLYNGPKPILYFRCLSEKYNVPDSIPNPDFVPGKGGFELLPYCRHPEEVEGAIPILQQAETTLAGESIMALNRLGKVTNENLIKVLNNILPDFAGFSTYIRSGNIHGYNSLLGCILIAMNDESLAPKNLVKGNKGPLAKIRALRQRIAEVIEPSLCAQENWTKTDAQIREALRNFDAPLESRAYYRALEEFFGIHIFIFKIITRDKISSVEFEIPFSKYFSLRYFDETRPCIFIERVEPKKGENESEPQYQLIMRHEEEMKNLTQRVFPPAITANAVNLYRRNYTVYHRDDKIHTLPLGLNALQLLPSGLEAPVSQIIDEAGKCRGFTFSNWSVLFPPTTPYELPRTPQAKISPISLDRFPKQFGTPVAVSRTEEQLIGLWFSNSLTVNHSEPAYYFLPILPTQMPKKWLNLPNLATYWDPKITDVQQNFELNYRSLRILYQVLRWLVAILGGKEENVVDIQKQAIYNPEVIYTFQVGRLLPEIQNYKAALDYLAENSTGLVTKYPDRRLVLPSTRILHQIRTSLWRSNPLWRFTNPRDLEKKQMPRVIPNFYVYRSDFQPGIIFGSTELEEKLYAERSLESSETVSSFNYPSFVSWNEQVFLFIPSSDSEEDRIAETAHLYEYFRGVKVPTDRIFVFGFDAKRRVLIPLENRTNLESGENGDYLPVIDHGILVPLL